VIGNLAALHASFRALAGDLEPMWEPTRRELVRPPAPTTL
jgi:hypothetical protein